MMHSVKESFALNNKVAVITGGAGLLGIKHAEAIAEMGGTSVLLDIDHERLQLAKSHIEQNFKVPILALPCNITCKDDLENALEATLAEFATVDILINNAAFNPKVESDNQAFTRLENYSYERWLEEINVGLTAAFFCSQIFGGHMAQKKKGVILNVASDLGLIAPNQSLYRQEGTDDHSQPVKPVTYSVIKHGLIGLTRYLATYWAEQGVRCNALAPGGVYNDQPEPFMHRIKELIPMRRMANIDEYKAAIVFLASEASSYMTGAVLTMDGGRTCW